MSKPDIVVTWPKSKPLDHYLAQLVEAVRADLAINYRVSSPPSWDWGALLGDRPPRCYMVHDGFVRGYNEVLDVSYKGEGEVKVVDAVGYWREGWYVVRSPVWYPLHHPVSMKGFRGWRWTDLADWNPPLFTLTVRNRVGFYPEQGYMVYGSRSTDRPDHQEVLVCPAPSAMLGETLEVRGDLWRIHAPELDGEPKVCLTLTERKESE